MGDANTSKMIAFYNSAHRQMAATSSSSTPTGFENAMSDLRFAPFEHGVRRLVLDAGLGFPQLNSPDLTGQSVFHVMKLRYLHYLVDPDSALANDVSLPIGIEPREPDAFLDDWDSIPDNDRSFILTGALGSPIVWFTNETGEQAARAYSRSTGLALADAFCEILGLGHHEAGDWLVLLRIPGSAIQEAHHYRPLFCDAVTHRYFMAHSCLLTSPSRPWGQTANLREMVLGNANYDGAFERVAQQLTPEHFTARDRISVELLGPVQRAKLFSSAPKKLADDVWARRRAA
jgi:hypothetical protein